MEFTCIVRLKGLHLNNNHVFFTGSVVGNRICSHPDIRKVGFTGSTETGKSIMERYSINNIIM